MARKQRKTQSPNTDASSTTLAEANNPGIEAPAEQQLPRRSVLLNTNLHRAIYLVLLAATYSPLSQLILSPVYGSIPASVYHKWGTIIAALLAFVFQGLLPPWLDKVVPAFTYWLPTMHFVLFKFSSQLGNPLGPLVTECLTTYPLITASMFVARRLLDQVDLTVLSPTIAEAGPSMFTYLLFTIFQRTMQGVLPMWLGLNLFFTRIGFQMMIATTYGLILPGSYFWPALPSIAWTLYGNVHTPLARTTDLLNNTLSLDGFTLLERRESLTGYISVLQNNNDNFRVMRCDHSLLGGEWTMAPDPRGTRKIAEPVYAVFTMLESVRLVERERETGSVQEHALNIGAGVGTAPSALIAHGINTTIIELDPIVLHFAQKYFSLPTTHFYYIGDAAAMVEAQSAELADTYDYIIHDVFTGGAEPVPLFTYEFLSGLHQMLKPNGVIAINYAGDLAMPSTSLIYRTITEIFPSCRVFREDDQISDDDTPAVGIKDDSVDFTNLVFICTKKKSPVRFRKAIEADFLGSASRKAYMVPKVEIPASKFTQQGDLLTRANAKELEKMHTSSAIGHWRLMRKVLPASVWENW